MKKRTYILLVVLLIAVFLYSCSSKEFETKNRTFGNAMGNITNGGLVVEDDSENTYRFKNHDKDGNTGVLFKNYNQDNETVLDNGLISYLNYYSGKLYYIKYDNSSKKMEVFSIPVDQSAEASMIFTPVGGANSLSAMVIVDGYAYVVITDMQNKSHELISINLETNDIKSLAKERAQSVNVSLNATNEALYLTLLDDKKIIKISYDGNTKDAFELNIDADRLIRCDVHESRILVEARKAERSFVAEIISNSEPHILADNARAFIASGESVYYVSETGAGQFTVMVTDNDEKGETRTLSDAFSTDSLLFIASDILIAEGDLERGTYPSFELVIPL